MLSPKSERLLSETPDTSPVEEGNPERKGMRNGDRGTETSRFDQRPMVLVSGNLSIISRGRAVGSSSAS